MEGHQPSEQLRLDITVLAHDRSKEVVLNPVSGKHSKQQEFIIWTRKLDITERVYVEESPHGELRAVKRVALRDESVINYRSELDVLGRLSKAEGFQKKLFVDFKGWFPSTFSDHVCFVMEYCRLGDVSQCFPGPLPEVVARSIGEQLLEALAVLHELGITHRDVKPQNVLVVEKTPIWVKLADFGMSKLTQEDNTELRTIVGTEGYMAPEVFGFLDDTRESSSYSSAVDIWSLGCLLYYVLTKRIPFVTFLALQAYANGDSGFPEIPLYEMCVSIDGRAFIQRLLLPSPEGRPKASKQLLSTWTINASNVPDSPPSYSEHPVNSPGDFGWDTIPVLIPPPGPEMCYYSSELLDLVQKTPSRAEHFDDLAVHQVGYENIENWRLDSEWFAGPITGTDRLRALLDSGANPNIHRNGYTALHLATKNRFMEWVEVLLQYGADMKIRTGEQETVLDLAVREMHHGACIVGSKMFKFLLDKGADPHLPTEVEHNLLHQLVRVAIYHKEIHKEYPWAVSTIRSSVEVLMKHGVDTEVKDLKGLTPLSYAITSRDERTAATLLAFGSSPNTLDPEGRTALHLAVSSNKVSTELVRRLIIAGANVNQKDMQYRSPLFVAARSTVKDEVINLLVGSKADCEFEDSAVMRRIRRARFWCGIKDKLYNLAEDAK